jgi:long-chain acyl-CoA synthetase
MGERVCAVVVPRQGRDLELDDLRHFAARQLAPFKCPEALYLVEELPQTPTGKIAKLDLRNRLKDVAPFIPRSW